MGSEADIRATLKHRPHPNVGRWLSQFERGHTVHSLECDGPDRTGVHPRSFKYGRKPLHPGERHCGAVRLRHIEEHLASHGSNQRRKYSFGRERLHRRKNEEESDQNPGRGSRDGRSVNLRFGKGASDLPPQGRTRRIAEPSAAASPVPAAVRANGW